MKISLTSPTSTSAPSQPSAKKAMDAGVRVVLLRIGVVIGPGGGALDAMLPLFRCGLGGSIGSGRQWWSWIHLEDLTALILHLLKQPVEGPFNATSPNPCRQKDFARALGRVLKRPTLLPTPGPVIKLAMGGFARELLSSRRVMPRRAEEEGFNFRFPEIEPALVDVISL